MSEIKTIKADALKDMKGKEGLILQGCGGKLEEWLDGIRQSFRSMQQEIVKELMPKTKTRAEQSRARRGMTR